MNTRYTSSAVRLQHKTVSGNLSLPRLDSEILKYNTDHGKEHRKAEPIAKWERRHQIRVLHKAQDRKGEHNCWLVGIIVTELFRYIYLDERGLYVDDALL
jgi:hypothetical protein